MSSVFPRRAPDYAALNTKPVAREVPQSAVARAEEGVEAARRRLARKMRELRDASVRERSIREGAVGRAVFDLVEKGQLETAVIDLIRAKVRECSGPAQVAAFAGTIFE
ncbi:hypothetical protein [Bradyrhizobium sp. 30]|uniref:hypothetical protein n=1 Tax=Bradyrhizobium sp. 30 TaxID=2782669 RepID=UPI001FF74336|nr:hypothetical protein [Bradyrhizobium sp. 30]MCK1293016.1 hypothetical protein [Bradyrhizobium sp. 30]